MENLLKNINRYLKTVEHLQIIPNFWMSEEYLLKSQALWVEDIYRGLYGFKVEDKNAEEWLLPPLNSVEQFSQEIPVFAGIPEICPPFAKFLDYQFVYDPKNFQNMEGHKWQTFRKNIRKYPKRTEGCKVYLSIKEKRWYDQIVSLLSRWGEDHDVFDPDTLVRFALQGDNRKGLFVEGHLVGLNIWDENHHYINFRYCLDDGSSFLNEYMRYLFYTDQEIIKQNKPVNDGGALDSEHLYRFKEKLNPVQILKVYSYRKRRNFPSKYNYRCKSGKNSLYHFFIF